MWAEAGRLTDWLGEGPIKAQLLKLSEEVGEVADVIITAAVTIVRLAGGPHEARAAFQAHLAGVVARAGLADTPTPPAGKLVRDRIPEFIREDGLDPVIRTAGRAEYASRLRDKLGEEVAEFVVSENDPVELADILEVVYALAADTGNGRAELEALRAAKAESNGAFSQRFVWYGNRAGGQ